MMFRDGLIRSRRTRAASRATAAERERMASAYAREHGLDGRNGDDRDIDLTEHDPDREHLTTF
jgi:hypothetical protein